MRDPVDNAAESTRIQTIKAAADANPDSQGFTVASPVPSGGHTPPPIPTMIYAPWTPEQVQALNEFQQGGWMHPFTCCGPGSCRDRLGGTASSYATAIGENTDRRLVATEAGWICETCDYTQDWAHSFMTKGDPWKKR